MADDRFRIVVAEGYSADAVARLRACGDVVELDAFDAATLGAAVGNADALLVRSYAQVTDEILAAAPRLRVVGRGGVGLENIDVAAARRREIAVVHTPAASTRSVAEHAVALMLAVERCIVAGHEAMQAGAFSSCRKSTRFRELGDCTLGVVGMGRIGTAVGRLCAVGLGMRVLYNDIAEVGPFDFPASPVSKSQLYAEADVVTLHVPLTKLTRNLIDADALEHVKAGAVLVNTCRGAVVDGEALAARLSAGQLAGAGLDVFDPEPLPEKHPLLSAPNVVLTPHTAGRSIPALQRMNNVVDDVVAVLEGRAPKYAAQGESG